VEKVVDNLEVNMRDIKFRVWDKENKEMLDVEDLHWDDCTREFSIRTTMYSNYFDIEDMILMQYTGLKDKNGKEIYEGDIVKHNGFYEGDCYYNAGCGQVLWDDEDTGFYLTAKDTSFINLFDLTRNLDGEIIGNIYENPELLEVE
jgi:uncharacterized phage protein (TIGR01671 family)